MWARSLSSQRQGSQWRLFWALALEDRKLGHVLSWRCLSLLGIRAGMTCLSCQKKPAKARGLCNNCYQHAWENHWRTGGFGFTRKVPYTHWSDYADDYELLRESGESFEQIAKRLGLKRAALSKALQRHRTDPRARGVAA